MESRGLWLGEAQQRKNSCPNSPWALRRGETVTLLNQPEEPDWELFTLHAKQATPISDPWTAACLADTHLQSSDWLLSLHSDRWLSLPSLVILASWLLTTIPTSYYMSFYSSPDWLDQYHLGCRKGPIRNSHFVYKTSALASCFGNSSLGVSFQTPVARGFLVSGNLFAHCRCLWKFFSTRQVLSSFHGLVTWRHLSVIHAHIHIWSQEWMAKANGEPWD